MQKIGYLMLEWDDDSYLTLSEYFVSYIMATCRCDEDTVRFVLDDHALVRFV
jgi:hypothetical protein